MPPEQCLSQSQSLERSTSPQLALLLGQLAAAWQASSGAAAAESAFSTLQSAAMGGYGVSAVVAVVGTGGAVVIARAAVGEAAYLPSQGSSCSSPPLGHLLRSSSRRERNYSRLMGSTRCLHHQRSVVVVKCDDVNLRLDYLWQCFTARSSDS